MRRERAHEKCARGLLHGTVDQHPRRTGEPVSQPDLRRRTIRSLWGGRSQRSGRWGRWRGGLQLSEELLQLQFVGSSLDSELGVVLRAENVKGTSLSAQRNGKFVRAELVSPHTASPGSARHRTPPSRTAAHTSRDRLSTTTCARAAVDTFEAPLARAVSPKRARETRELDKAHLWMLHDSAQLSPRSDGMVPNATGEPVSPKFYLSSAPSVSRQTSSRPEQRSGPR